MRNSNNNNNNNSNNNNNNNNNKFKKVLSILTFNLIQLLKNIMLD